jgi:hypothetical protein
MSEHGKSAPSGDKRDDRQKGGGELGEAALSLERELLRFEELTAAARRSPPTSKTSASRRTP